MKATTIRKATGEKTNYKRNHREVKGKFLSGAGMPSFFCKGAIKKVHALKSHPLVTVSVSVILIVK